jgi:hypothetical protein
MMNLLDKLALSGRRYEQAHVPRNGSGQFTLADVLEMFNFNTILELTPIVDGKPRPAMRPDAVRKLKVSLLDGISAIHSHDEDWYEVHRTAPSGDLALVRITAYNRQGGKVGELQMLVSQRMPQYYFGEDPILEEIGKQG